MGYMLHERQEPHHCVIAYQRGIQHVNGGREGGTKDVDADKGGVEDEEIKVLVVEVADAVVYPIHHVMSCHSG